MTAFDMHLITSDPSILGGKPCVTGTRLSVDFLLELLASGATQAQIVEAYPQLSSDGLQAALSYAAWTLRSESIWDVKIPA